jgi:uncharacterized protein RhaS with RHS repeats
MFHSNLGRWMQQDPIGFDAGDTNLYRYVGNDPVNSLDPSGLEEIELTSDAQIDGLTWSSWKGTVPDGLSENRPTAFTGGTI